MAKIRIGYQTHKLDYFTCVLFFWYSTEILFGTTIESIAGIPKETLNEIQSYLILALLMMQIIFFQRYKKQELFKMALFGILAIVVTIRSGYLNTLISFVLFVFAAKDLDFDKTIHMVYRISLVMVPAIMLLCVLGVLDNLSIRRALFGLRYSMGFGHPNTLGKRIFALVACHFYLRFHELKWWDYCLATGAIVFCYMVPNSQTAILLLALMIVVIALYKLAQRVHKQKLFMYSLITGAFVCNAGSILLSSIDLTPYPKLLLLDTFINNRFTSCHRVMQIYGVKLFGQVVDYQDITTESLFLDNSYCSILLIYGVVLFLVFSYLYLKCIQLQINKGRADRVIFLFLTAVYGVTERTLFTLSVNIFLLLLADAIYRPLKGSKDQKETYNE